MSKEFSPQTIHGRIVFIISFGLLCTSILLARVADLQVFSGDRYRHMADENRFFTIPLFAPRGIIEDVDGKPLVQNTVQLFVASSSAHLLFGDVWSLHRLQDDESRRYLLSSPSSILVRSLRSVYVDPALEHLVGYVGYQEDVGQQTSVRSDMQVGKTGIERYFDAQLRGSDGKQVVEISALGAIQRRLFVSAQVRRGTDVHTSIDSQLSAKALALMNKRSGAVVVADVQSNKLRVLVSSPSYDTHDIGHALADEGKPLLNRALRSYPPGSTWKLMTALAALDSGKVDTATLVNDTGQIQAGTQTFGNWYWRQYGKVEGQISIRTALARSNDIFFYSIAQTVGPHAIRLLSQEFGMGKKTGVELPFESVGVTPDEEWKENVQKEKWYLGDTYNLGIGQGYVLATPLQILNMTSAVARRGNWCTITLLTDGNVNCTQSHVASVHLETVVEGMVDACSPGGTGSVFFSWNAASPDDKKVACKTGTAEFGTENDQGRKRTHGWFTMFYPSKNPQVAITVFLESTKESPYIEGSRDAGPIAKGVFDAWREKYE